MTNRCYYLDLTKVLATLLVILGHVFPEDATVRLYIYAFHMPLFFLVSGIFHKCTGKINLKRYFQTLLWPTFICIILHILYGLLFRAHDLIYYWNLFFVDIVLGRHEGVFWFIFALFWCKVFMDIWGIFHRTGLLFFLWLVLLFVPVLLNRRLPLHMTNGLMAFPFYVAGYCGKDYLLGRKPSVKYLLPFALCLALTVLITLFHGRVSMMAVHFGQLAKHFGVEPMSVSILTRLCFMGGDVILFYLNGLIGSAMILCLSLLPIPEIPAVGKLSKSLITVLGTQYIFISLAFRLLGPDHTLWGAFLLSIVVFALCYGLHLILRPVYRLVQ